MFAIAICNSKDSNYGNSKDSNYGNSKDSNYGKLVIYIGMRVLIKKDGICFENLQSQFENKETVLNW